MEIPKPDPLPVQTECAAKPMLVDLKLIQRIEDAIAAERSAFADGMAALARVGGALAPVAGGRAIFTGADFFSNRALAMGLRGPVSHDDLERIETFYAECGVVSEVEIASMVDRSLPGRSTSAATSFSASATSTRRPCTPAMPPAPRLPRAPGRWRSTRSTPPPPWPGRQPCSMDSGTRVTPTATESRPGTR